jgi:hypothetical protein
VGGGILACGTGGAKRMGDCGGIAILGGCGSMGGWWWCMVGGIGGSDWPGSGMSAVDGPIGIGGIIPAIGGGIPGMNGGGNGKQPAAPGGGTETNNIVFIYCISS